MVELSAGELVAIVVALAAFVYSLITYVRANPGVTPGALDGEVARRLEEQQRDREHMDRLERAYQSNSAVMQKAFESVIAGLRFVAPLTPAKSDDAALAFFEDVQKPGAPVEPPASAS